MDIAHDRAGYYLCWGCLNWVPAIYTSPALYITEHPIDWSLPAAVAIGIAGTAAIYINYDSDRQRQVRLAIIRPALGSSASDSFRPDGCSTLSDTLQV